MNPFVLGLVSAVIAVLVYIVNSKIEKEEINNKTLVKMGLFGASLSTMCVFLSSFASETSIKLDQDIITGTPNF